jgi:hypothetical protein
MASAWKAARLEVLLPAAGLAILLYAGCVEGRPTDVPDDPSEVVRGYSDHRACLSTEVITSSSETTDTVLVTFNSVLAPEATSCYPNLVPWGIDVADPAGVDTPQGNGYARIETAYPIANMPSPPHAVIGGLYTPPEFMIEFDPPVRTVQFYYSRTPRSRAIWPGDIGAGVETDSTLVQATSRHPGTFIYDLYDSETLYTNSSAGAWDGWDSVKLTSFSGDKIQWLKVYGWIAMDNLKVTRQPLTCTPAFVQRGQQVSCAVTLATGWGVTSWEFIPDGSEGAAAAAGLTRSPGTEELVLSAQASSLPPVQESSSSKVWSGIAAVSGTVRVNTSNGGSLRTYQGRFTVTNRVIDWKSKWSYRQGPEQTVADAEVPSSGGAFGRNCPEQFAEEANCIGQERSRLQPDPVLQPGAGYTSAMIPSGPNKGYWYVFSILYDMKRVGNVHPGMLVTSPRKHPVPSSALTRDCKRGLGVPQKATAADANMNQFNQFCAPANFLGTDMTIFVPAIMGHEGFGYNGGVGHETLGRQAASEPQNDPYKAIENLVFPDPIALADEVNVRVRPIGEDITLKARDGNAINGGPKGNYDPAAFPNREMWFWEVGSAGSLTWVRHPLTSKY